MKRTLLALAVVMAGCSSLTGESGENYQHILRLLCAAPPQIMQSVLTTDQLRTAWLFICTHVDSVPKYPVPANPQVLAGQ